MEKERIKEIVEQLKVVKAEKGYSYQKIADMTEKIGDPVSLSTVRRVFTESAHNFRWDTIRPIATAVLGVGFETPKPDADNPNQPQEYYSQIEGLKALVEAKIETVAAKDKNIEQLKGQLEKQEAEYENKIKQIEKASKRYRIAAIILSVIVFGFLLIDFLNHNIGFLFMKNSENILEMLFPFLFS